MKILIVEDDPVSLEFLKGVLKGLGELEAAVDGSEALTHFTKALSEGSSFDLVLLDIMMPHLDGHEVLKSFRELESESKLEDDKASKIIIVSALEDEQNVINAFGEGCDSYLTKPIKKDDLLEKIKELGLLKA